MSRDVCDWRKLPIWRIPFTSLLCLSWSLGQVPSSSSTELATYPDSLAVSYEAANDSLYIPSNVALGEDPTRGRQFEGFHYAETQRIVPDPHCAASEDYVVTVGNSVIEFFHQETGSTGSPVQLISFFGIQDAPFDPRVIYDFVEQRFVVIALVGNTSATSELHIAVSSTNDPTSGTWATYSEDGSAEIDEVDTWADFPAIGISEDAIYITTNQAPDESNSVVGQRVRIIDKEELFENENYESTTYDPTGDLGEIMTITPAQLIGTPSNFDMYLAGYSPSFGNEVLTLFRVTNPLSTPTFTPVTISVSGIDTITLTPTPIPGAPQPEGADDLDAGDRRVLDAVWRDGALWLVAHVLPPSGPDAGEVTAHWWRLNTGSFPPTLGAQGNIGGEDLGSGTSTFYPAVSVDGEGNALFCFAASSENLYAGAYVVGLPSGGSTLGSTLTLAEGLDTYEVYDTYNRNRWGDYFGLAVDPVRPVFWAFGEYALSGGTTWGTRLGQFGFPTTVAVPGAEPLQTAVNRAVPGTVIQVDGEDQQGTQLTYAAVSVQTAVTIQGIPGQKRPRIEADGASIGVIVDVFASPISTELIGLEIAGFDDFGVAIDQEVSGSVEILIDDCRIVGDATGGTGVSFDTGQLTLTDTIVDSVEVFIAPAGSGSSSGTLSIDNCLASVDQGISYRSGVTVLIEDSTIQSVYAISGGAEYGIACPGGLGDLSLTQVILMDFGTDYFDKGSGGCPAEIINCLFEATSATCSIDASNLTNTDPLFCYEEDGDLPKGMMRIDSPAFAGNNAFDVDIGWDAGEKCGWGTLASSVTLGADSVLVIEDVTVPSGKTLTVGPGAILRFDADDDSDSGYQTTTGPMYLNEIVVDGGGTLEIGENGQTTAVLTSASQPAQPSDWGGIAVVGNGSVTIENTEISGARIALLGYGTSDIDISNSEIAAAHYVWWGQDSTSVTATDLGVNLTAGSGFYTSESDTASIYIKDSDIATSGPGIRSYGPLYVENSTIHVGSSFGVQAMDGSVTIVGPETEIAAPGYSGSVGIRLGVDATISDCSVQNFGTGVWSSGSADLTMTSGAVSDCDWGVWFEGTGALQLGQNDSTQAAQILVSGSTEVGVAVDSPNSHSLTQVRVTGGSDDDWAGIQIMPDADATLTRCAVAGATGSNAAGILVESEVDLRAPDVSGVDDGIGILVNVDSLTTVTIREAGALGSLWTNPVVEDCETGMSVQGYSRPSLRDGIVSDHHTCIYIGPVAIPDAGTDMDWGYNTISGASYKLAGGSYRLGGTPDVPAEGNYWGSNPPNASKISAWVDYVPYLSSDPHSPSSIAPEVAAVIPREVVVFPTPSQGAVRIGYQVPASSAVSVRVYDLQGRMLRTVEHAVLSSGAYFNTWDGRTTSGVEVPAGVYFVQVRVGSQVRTQRIIRTP